MNGQAKDPNDSILFEGAAARRQREVTPNASSDSTKTKNGGAFNGNMSASVSLQNMKGLTDSHKHGGLGQSAIAKNHTTLMETS